MENQTLDLVAKLLANENIHVVRAPVTTAAFNIHDRTLILPQWREMTPAIDEMLVGHEVGHALYTTEEYTATIENNIVPHSFLNILEDVRIEKLMKRRYPGLRKVFNAGYRELNNMDFFGVRGRDLRTAHLLDRINLYFKVGYGVVEFSPLEKPFIVRADNLETIDEVIDLAVDIKKFLKEQEEKARQEAEANAAAGISDEDDIDDGEGFGEGEEFEIPEIDDEDTDHSFNQLMDNSPQEEGEQEEGDSVNEDTPDQDVDNETSDEDEAEGDLATAASIDYDPTESEEPVEAELTDSVEEPITNGAFEDRVAELADTNTSYRYYTLGKYRYNPMVSYKEVFAKITSYYDNNTVSLSTIDEVRMFKQDTMNNVNYLVKEFEMRKAATAYKRAQTSKVGSLDMKRVWSYKLNDDLFKRVTTVKQGKNHGMVMLLDWSGSMQNVIKDTLEQVINLAMFCQRAGIAYQVLAFTDNYDSEDCKRFRAEQHFNRENGVVEQSIPGVINPSQTRMALLELFSNKMTTSDFNQMIILLKSLRVQRVFGLNGTPLNESLAYMYEYLGEFQRKNNVEKTSFITLTDGIGSSLHYFERVAWSNTGGRIKIRNFIKDTFTKKNLEVTSDAGTHTVALLEMIKARYNCTVIGFHLTRNNRRDLIDAIRANQPNQDITYDQVDKIKAAFRTDGYYSMQGTGRDELFVVPLTSTRVQYETLQVDGSANARSIASKFGKYMNTKKTSRILLNKFIGHVA